MKKYLIALGLSAAFSGFANAETYNLEPTHSYVEFHYNHMGILIHLVSGTQLEQLTLKTKRSLKVQQISQSRLATLLQGFQNLMSI